MLNIHTSEYKIDFFCSCFIFTRFTLYLPFPQLCSKICYLTSKIPQKPSFYKRKLLFSFQISIRLLSSNLDTSTTFVGQNKLILEHFSTIFVPYYDYKHILCAHLIKGLLVMDLRNYFSPPHTKYLSVKNNFKFFCFNSFRTNFNTSDCTFSDIIV